MRHFFSSLIFFIKIIFRKQSVDVLFYYPHHFNRGDNSENMYFQHLYKSCIKNNLSYLIFEEPDFKNSNYKRSKLSTPFDFIYLIIILLRKLNLSDKNIGKILSVTFLRGLTFKNYIVLSQSMLTVFRHVCPQAKLFDLQHGIIHKDQLSYIKDNMVADNISKNNVYLLLFGHKFKNILIENDHSKYFSKSISVIGANLKKSLVLHNKFNQSILVTMQFTDDHSFDENQILFYDLVKYVEKNLDYLFILRNHPRFNDNIDLGILLRFNNVRLSSSSLYDDFKSCSIHLTSYSTSVIESARYGIPTIFLRSLDNYSNIFLKQYHYPFFDSIGSIEKDYRIASSKVLNWQKDFICDFDQNKFISLLS